MIGDIYFVSFRGNIGSEQKGNKPVIILREQHSELLVSVITSKTNKPNLPTHVLLYPTANNGLSCASVVMLEQLYTIPENQLGNRVGKVERNTVASCYKALKISLDLTIIGRNYYDRTREDVRGEYKTSI